MMRLIRVLWGFFANIITEITLFNKFPKQDGKSILFIIPWLTFGGAEKVNLEILEALKRDNWNIYIVTTKSNKHEWESKFKEITPNILHIENLPEKLHTYIFLKVIQRAKIEITFISNSFTGYKATPHISRYSIIVDLVHGEGGKDDNGGAALFSSTYDKFINKRIVISDRLKDLYINQYSIEPSKIEVIRNGIDISETLNEAGGAVFPEVLESFENTPKKVVWVGRLSKEKQPLKVIELAKQMPDYIFIIIGDGELYDDVVKGCLTLTNVIALGALENSVVKKVVSKSDMLILTSEYEGIPVAILEALALSKPVVATDVGAINEIIIDGYNGYLVNPENINEIMPKLINKAYMNRNVLGSNSFKIINSKFNKQNMQSEYLRVFNKIINE